MITSSKGKYMKKESFNNYFIEQNIDLKIIDENEKNFIFSSGIEENKVKLYRRYKNERYFKYFYDLYGISYERKIELERRLKSEVASLGGKAVQKKYGEKIKENLNTGIPWNKDKKGLQVGWCAGKNKHNDERMKSFSESRMGSGNPMYGRKLSEKTKKILSKKMKENILNGKFTPNIQNSLTHWQSTYEGKKFRSSWEALFYKFNKDYEYEKQRIKYSFNNKEKIYIVDFVNYTKKHLVEIKPSTHKDSVKQKAKEKALQKFCKDNRYSYSILDESWFKQNYNLDDITDFDKNTYEKLAKVLG